MIRVLVVEDNPIVCEFLLQVFGAATDFVVAGCARNDEAAVAEVMRLRPDVIAMDVHIPSRDNFNMTRRIMEKIPTPIVIVTRNSNTDEADSVFHALDAGALAIAQIPTDPEHANYEHRINTLVDTVRLMSAVKVVRRWPRKKEEIRRPLPSPPTMPKLIVIGASTGGPVAIQSILSGLEIKRMPPIVIVQHISEGFVAGFAKWLADSTQFPVRLAKQGDIFQSGQIYIAPEGKHLGLGSGLTAELSDASLEQGSRPSVSYLFRSARQQIGKQVIAILLTGMGSDGAEELLQLRHAGALTIAQSKDSSAVHGMPGEAIKRGAATKILSPDEIAVLLNQLMRACSHAIVL